MMLGMGERWTELMMVLGLGVSPSPELPEIPSFTYSAYSRPFCEMGTEAENALGSGDAGSETRVVHEAAG